MCTLPLHRIATVLAHHRLHQVVQVVAQQKGERVSSQPKNAINNSTGAPITNPRKDSITSRPRNKFNWLNRTTRPT